MLTDLNVIWVLHNLNSSENREYPQPSDNKLRDAIISVKCLSYERNPKLNTQSHSIHAKVLAQNTYDALNDSLADLTDNTYVKFNSYLQG